METSLLPALTANSQRPSALKTTAPCEPRPLPVPVPPDAADPSRAGYERILILLSRAVPGRRSAGAQRKPGFRDLDRPARGARVSLHRFFEAALRLGDGGHGEPPHLRPRREVDVHLSSDRQLGAKERVARERLRVPAVAHREIA